MKRAAVVLLLSWVLGYGLAFAIDVKTIDGPGGWVRDGNTIRVQNPETDIIILDNFSTVNGGMPGELDFLSVANDVAFKGDTTVFNDYSAINSRYIIMGNATTAGFPINLDSIANYREGQNLWISKIDSTTNTVTITPAAGNTISGESSIVFAAKGDTLTLHNDGTTDWKVLQRAIVSEAGSALLHADNELGIFYPLSTAFRQFTSFDTTLTSSTVTADLGTQSIVINAAGRYDIHTHIIGEAVSGSLVEIGAFLNLTTEVDEAGAVIPAGAEHFTTFLNISTGSIVSGTIADLKAADGNIITLDEVNSATPGAVYTFKFENVIAPDTFHWAESAYDGSSGHDTKVYVLNDTFGTYTAVTANLDDLPHTGSGLANVYSRDFEFPDSKFDYVSAAGEVFVRIIHTSIGSPGDQYLIDKIFLSDAFSSISVITANFVDLDVGDSISLKIKDGLNGLVKIRHAGIKVHRIGD